jgi:hypothetical protein
MLMIVLTHPKRTALGEELAKMALTRTVAIATLGFLVIIVKQTLTIVHP